MNFKNEFVAHSKVHIDHFTGVKKDCSKGNMIYFGSRKTTRIEIAVDKSYCNKITLGEITIGKSARFKFLEIDFVFTIGDFIVL
tara:strand:- start:38361 stop:38612 length:252 start_codon:yes stop_codon:yes gene_type:complete